MRRERERTICRANCCVAPSAKSGIDAAMAWRGRLEFFGFAHVLKQACAVIHLPPDHVPGGLQSTNGRL
jgi:hypothetical protein